MRLVNLLGLVPDKRNQELTGFFTPRGKPAYRVGQVTRWIVRGARSFDEMTDLPTEERGLLRERYTVREPHPLRIERSADGTAKHLWRLEDGELVESVLIPTVDRLTLCLSSQAGCALKCTFCGTGWAGFRRQLDAGEIVSQYRASRRWATENELGPITNVVFMGMGEPLANRDAVFDTLTILNRTYEVGARRITVSTVGVVPGILELAERPEQFRLALSLHATDSRLRERLIPLERQWPLPEVVSALRAFDASGGKRITFEYTLIRDINDDPDLASDLASLAYELRAFVNLIPYNPIPFQDWRPIPPERIEHFRRVLDDHGVKVAVREPRGRDIEAACGQLRADALVRLESPR